MLAFKRFVTIVVLVHLLLMLLFLLFPAVRNTMEGMDSAASQDRETNFFGILTWVSVIVLGLQLIVENLDSSLLRRSLTQHEVKINELKAKMYDHEQRNINPALAPALPTPPAAVPTNLGDYPAGQPLA